MFYEMVTKICKREGKDVAGMLRDLRLSSSKATEWKKGGLPRVETVQRIAEYLDVSMDYLMTGREARCTTEESEILSAYHEGSLKEQNIVRVTLGLPQK